MTIKFIILIKIKKITFIKEKTKIKNFKNKMRLGKPISIRHFFL